MSASLKKSRKLLKKRMRPKRSASVDSVFLRKNKRLDDDGVNPLLDTDNSDILADLDLPLRRLEDLQSDRDKTKKAYDQAKANGNNSEARRLLWELEKINDLIDTYPKSRLQETSPGDSSQTTKKKTAVEMIVDDLSAEEIDELEKKSDAFQQKVNAANNIKIAAAQWEKYGKAANKEYLNLRVNDLGKKYAKVVDNQDWLLMSEPHNNKKSGFTLAYKTIKNSKKPGVLMLEAPSFFNKSPDMLKTISYWSNEIAKEAMYAQLAQAARDKGWEVVTVDGVKADDSGLVDAELLKKSGIPGTQNQKTEKGIGSVGRQKYIARNVHTIMDKVKDRGGILLIGTAHIEPNKTVPVLSKMVSNQATREKFKEMNTRKNKPMKVGRPFRVVTVDSEKVLDNPDYTGKAVN